MSKINVKLWYRVDTVFSTSQCAFYVQSQHFQLNQMTYFGLLQAIFQSRIQGNIYLKKERKVFTGAA